MVPKTLAPDGNELDVEKTVSSKSHGKVQHAEVRIIDSR